MLKKPLTRGFFSCIAAAEITLAADLVCAFSGHPMPMAVYFILFVGCLSALFFIKKLSNKKILLLAAGLFVLFLITALAVGGALIGFAKAGRYRSADDDKAALFADRSVMIIAPHQDDELSIMSGTLFEYIGYGSEVKIVFTTNGDYVFSGERRLTEALRVAEYVGIDEEDVIFLGYGDDWSDGVHIYNSPDDEQRISYAGFSESYALAGHPPYNGGLPYTRAQYREDIKNVILEYRPDVIFCPEYEPHADHRAAALLVDEAMAEILAEEDGYTPLILKSISYHTSYFGETDFYAENILSIPNPYETEYASGINIHKWSDRVRLPVSAESLSRSILSSSTYQALRLHGSQGCNRRGESIISGDTVFWQRDTSAISYGAKVSASSGDASRLNDFKLLHDEDIAHSESPFDAAWIPTDSEKLAEMRFDEPVDISEIWIYDHPSFDHNILQAEISFDDGSCLMSGALEANGSATKVAVDKKGVSSFSLRILDSEGEEAGITEIEVFAGQKDYGLDFVKLENLNGDFVYDYYIEEDGEETFVLYTSGKAPGLENGAYSISCDNAKCSAEIGEDSIVISCPKGESCTVTVESADGEYSDSVIISNPGSYMRSIGQRFEVYARKCYYKQMQHVNTYLLLRNAYRLVRYGYI